MSDTECIARHLIVHGKVQGVSYRASAQFEAQRLNLQGWIRNRCDGTVEIQVTGPTPAVERFLAWAQHGPRHARVSRVDLRECEHHKCSGFTMRPTE